MAKAYLGDDEIDTCFIGDTEIDIAYLGNDSVCDIFVPNTIPVITIAIGNTAHPMKSGYIDSGVTASDFEDGNITGDIVRTGATDVQINASKTRGQSFTIIYNVVDSQGLAAAQVTRDVIITFPLYKIYSLNTRNSFASSGAARPILTHVDSNIVYEDWGLIVDGADVDVYSNTLPSSINNLQLRSSTNTNISNPIKEVEFTYLNPSVNSVNLTDFLMGETSLTKFTVSSTIGRKILNLENAFFKCSSLTSCSDEFDNCTNFTQTFKNTKVTCSVKTTNNGVLFNRMYNRVSVHYTANLGVSDGTNFEGCFGYDLSGAGNCTRISTLSYPSATNFDGIFKSGIYISCGDITARHCINTNRMFGSAAKCVTIGRLDMPTRNGAEMFKDAIKLQCIKSVNGTYLNSGNTNDMFDNTPVLIRPATYNKQVIMSGTWWKNPVEPSICSQY